jgi:hypothetical protein
VNSEICGLRFAETSAPSFGSDEAISPERSGIVRTAAAVADREAKAAATSPERVGIERIAAAVAVSDEKLEEVSPLRVGMVRAATASATNA